MTLLPKTGFTGVSADHRQLKGGELFFEIPGAKFDPRTVREQVRSLGCQIVGETDGVDHRVPDVRQAFAQASADWFKNPSHTLTMIGVTGTSGKTTTTFLLEAILTAAGQSVGVIGTINTRFAGRVIEATHTTPMAHELQERLAEMVSAGVQTVVMEVSSHALKQHRVSSIAWDACVFTNLSPEHMDYHPDMEDYFRSKARLFNPTDSVTAGKSPKYVVCGSDAYGQRLSAELKSQSLAVVPFGRGAGLHLTDQGIEGTYSGVDVRCALEGSFNLTNIEGAILAAQSLGIQNEAISLGLSSVQGVPGRMQRVRAGDIVTPRVFVDYAHKPDALQKVLSTLRDRGLPITTVFGCGGDRDRTKRPVMGRIAAELSARVIVTSDNPRTESPAAIIDEILAGIPAQHRPQVEIEADRPTAIRRAILECPQDAIVLIAGKGHEDYQIIGTKKIPMSDVNLAQVALQNRRPGPPR